MKIIEYSNNSLQKKSDLEIFFKYINALSNLKK